VLAEYDGDGNFQKMNVFGNYIDDVLMIVDYELSREYIWRE